MDQRAPSLLLLLVTLTLAVCAVGCGGGLVPFTHELRTQHDLSNDDLKNLQYYASHRITLRRELESGGRRVTGSHKLLVLSGKTIEEVVVEEGTPGVAVKVDASTMSVSFEAGTSLVFAVASEGGVAAPSLGFAEPPDPFPGNDAARREPESFPTAVDLLGGSYFLAAEPGGRVPFQGRLFSAVEDSLRAHLLIDSESLEEVVKNRKVLPGVRLSTRDFEQTTSMRFASIGRIGEP